jgi:hypothetical protein
MSSARRFGAGGAFLILGLTLFSTLGTATPASATTLRRLELPEMVAVSDRIVHARVVRNRVYWNADHTRIFTDTDFDVIADAKGMGPNKLTITQLGGRIDPIDVQVEGTPTFAVGEETILFTQLHPNGQRLIVGMSQGVMRISEDASTGAKVATSQVPGNVTFVGGRPQRGGAPLDVMLDQIRQMAAGASRAPGNSMTPATDPVKPGGGNR